MKYYLNGIDFATYGVRVSASSGAIDGLKLKEPKEMDWDGYHGKVVALSAPRYQHRELTLECFIVQPSKVDVIQKANDFMRELSKAGTQRLMIDTEEAKPLVYEVYQNGGFSIKKRWRSGQNVGEFTLKLIEPEPVKRVLKHIRTGDPTKTASVTLTSNKMVTIYWGDGTKTGGERHRPNPHARLCHQWHLLYHSGWRYRGGDGIQH